jgi:hypothetical protein
MGRQDLEILVDPRGFGRKSNAKCLGLGAESHIEMLTVADLCEDAALVKGHP